MKLQIDSHNSINTKPQSQTKQARNYAGIYISAINHRWVPISVRQSRIWS